MSIFERRPALRWFAPLALVAVVGGSGLLATTASADGTLAPKSAEQLLVDVQNARVDGLSGTVVQTANLGLPALPSTGGADTQELTSLLSGNHTLKVWTAGPTKSRIEVMDDLAATDVVVNGSDVWTWSSSANKATHRTVPQHEAGKDAAHKAPVSPDVPATPQEAAQQVLDAIGPSTTVTVGNSSTVAGHDAYELLLAPKDKGSKIAQVRIAVDADTSVPLDVAALATDGSTVFDVGFKDVTFGAPDEGQFTFSPPPGAKVAEGSVPSAPKAPTPADKKAAEKKAADAKESVTTVGKGWSTVVVAEVGTDALGSPQAAGVLNRLPRVSGTGWSGRLFDGPAFSAVVTDDGRVAVGAVDKQLLFDALDK